MKKFFLGIADSSVLWGLVSTFAFYFALHRGWIQSETLVRYCAGHPVEYATTGMFWIGLCDLAFKLARTAKERRGLKRGLLFPPKKSEKESLELVDGYLKTLDKARAVRGESSFLRRLNDALSFLKFGGAPDDLDQELRFLADDDADRRESNYGMVKTFIWAIPILGFLGTVLGITVALGSLDLTKLEATGELLAAGLKVAFDTTALALTLVFILYFTLFFVRKQETELAANVARLVDSELKGRFIADADRDAAKEAEFETTRRMLSSIAASFEEMTKTQTALWSEAMANVAKKSAELSNDAATRLGGALDVALQNGVSSWAKSLSETQTRFVEETIRPTLEETARKTRRLDALEEKVARETEALAAVLRASADVVSLEDRLTRTLEQIARVGDFEKTLNNLSATVCLLNSKLIGATSDVPSVSTAATTRRFDARPALAAESRERRELRTPQESRESLAKKQADAFAALEALEKDLSPASASSTNSANSINTTNTTNAPTTSRSTKNSIPINSPTDSQSTAPKSTLVFSNLVETALAASPETATTATATPTTSDGSNVAAKKGAKNAKNAKSPKSAKNATNDAPEPREIAEIAEIAGTTADFDANAVEIPTAEERRARTLLGKKRSA